MDGKGRRRAVSYGRNSSAKQRSIAAQMVENRTAADGLDADIIAELTDSTSASRYTKKVRANWAALLAMLSTVDIVLLWEASRGDRTLASWIGFVDTCRERGVLIHATGHGTTYDPRKPRDYRSLAEDGVDAAYESDKTSLRLRRGLAALAASGRPHATATYGYERIYNPRTGILITQRPHPEHAEVVREIVRRIGAGDPVSAVATDLTRRQIPPPLGATVRVQEMVRRVRNGETPAEVAANLVKRGVLPAGGRGKQAPTALVARVVDRALGVNGAEPEKVSLIADELVEEGILDPAVPWKTQTVASIASNRAYLGVRVHHRRSSDRTEYPAEWPAIVTEAEHHAALRVLTAPGRQFNGPRPGRANSLLGNIAYCGTCGGKLSAKSGAEYRCCTGAPRDELEDLVTEVVLARLSDPKVHRSLRRASDSDDRTVVAARAEIDRLTAELATWRQSAIDGKTSPDSLAVIEAGITAKIRDAQRRADHAGTPPALRHLVEPGIDIRQRWHAAPLGARREIIRTLLTITVHRSARRRDHHDLTKRVEITWRTS